MVNRCTCVIILCRKLPAPLFYTFLCYIPCCSLPTISVIVANGSTCVILCRKLPTPLFYTLFFVTQRFCKEAKLSRDEYDGPPREVTEIHHQAQAVALVCCKPTEVCPSALPKKSYDLIVLTAQKVYKLSANTKII